LTDQGQALENLSLRVDPGNGYFESLTYAGRIPRVKTGAQQVYQISGSEACRDVVYSAGHPRITGYNSYDSTACNASSYLRVVCEADYPGRDFSYDYH